MKHIFLLFLPILLLLPCMGQERYAPIPEWYNDYDVKFYKIDIEANDTSAEIRGYTEIVAEIIVPDLEQFTLELAENVEVDSVWINGRFSSFQRKGNYLHVYNKGLQMSGLCSVTVFYTAFNSRKTGFFSALTNRRDNSWDIPVTWTLSEPFNAKNWFPCKQHLPDKADSAYIYITVPENLKAGAPGILSTVTPMPDGKMRYEWITRYPVAYYLLSFTVADYQDYTIYANIKDVENPVPIQNFIYNRDGYLEKNKESIDTTIALMKLYSEMFIPYPFADEKYGHCVAPMGGGMEHQTMTTLSGFDFLLVAHELAHQWFGNLVTCASFQDVWINEGFASYAEYLALERMASREMTLTWLRETHNLASWTQRGSVFVPEESADDDWRIFNASLSYKKGALLVHQIRKIIDNDELFFDILRGFLRKYSFSVASFRDFKQYLEEQSGKDFTQFFDLWYFGEGFPIFDISWKNNNGDVEIRVGHTGSAPATPLFQIDLDVQMFKSDGSNIVVQLPIRSHQDFFNLKNVGDVIVIEIDPGYYILKQLHSACRVRDFPTDDSFLQCNTHIKRRLDLTISFLSEINKNCKARLTDTNGEKVFAEIAINRKQQELIIQMEHLPNATYLLYVQNGKELYVRKIVKTPF